MTTAHCECVNRLNYCDHCRQNGNAREYCRLARLADLAELNRERVRLTIALRLQRIESPRGGFSLADI